MFKRIETLQENLDRTVARATKTLRRFSVLDVLFDTVDSFIKDNMDIVAASLSYYALLALFPLLLVLIVVVSLFLSNEDALRIVLRESNHYLPGTEIQNSVSQVLALRGSASFIGLIALVWTASGVFDVLQFALDRAWHVPRPRALWLQRVYSITVVGALGFLFVVSVVVSTLSGSLILNVFGENTFTFVGIRVLGRGIALGMSMIAFALIYKTFPHARVPWHAALWGAVVAALLWELAKFIFEYYLVNIAGLNLIYGSVGAIIGLLLWSYISAMILLFGAELSASAARRVKSPRVGELERKRGLKLET